jgi:hypothetical protein
MDVRRGTEVAGEDEDSYTIDDSIPLADGDPADFVDDSVVSEDQRREFEWRKKVDFESLDSIPSMLSDRSDLGYQPGSGHISDHMNRMSLDPDFSPDEQEEKARLISQVLELQNTLDDLTHRVDKVKEENLKLKSENSVLGQYIENLMQVQSSAVLLCTCAVHCACALHCAAQCSVLRSALCSALCIVHCALCSSVQWCVQASHVFQAVSPKSRRYVRGSRVVEVSRQCHQL